MKTERAVTKKTSNNKSQKGTVLGKLVSTAANTNITQNTNRHNQISHHNISCKIKAREVKCNP